MKKIAIVPARGIGDALIFHAAAHALQKEGFLATTLSPHLSGFGKWLTKGPSISDCLDGYDAVFLQHDNSPKSREIHALPLPVYTFYGSHLLSKHGPLRKGFDFVCDPNRTMVDNLSSALLALFGIDLKKAPLPLQPPADRIYRRFPKRIAIHSSSSSEEKNWPLSKFLKVAERLETAGYEPLFATKLPSLEELASTLYESGAFLGNDSGPGHIASLLAIPHLIIAPNEQQMRLWRPGWTPGTLVLPPPWLPRKWWKKSITTNKVLKYLKYKVLRN